MKVDEVEDDIDFFSLGGDSLKLLQLTNEINKTYTVEISLPDLFRNSTPKRIEKLLKNKMKESFNTKKNHISIFNFEKENKNSIFLFHPIGGKNYRYQYLINYLKDGNNIYFVESINLEGDYESIEDMVDAYSREIENLVPPLAKSEQKICLIGYSMGGIICNQVHGKLKSQGLNSIKVIIDMHLDNIDYSKENSWKNFIENRIGWKKEFDNEYLEFNNNSLDFAYKKLVDEYEYYPKNLLKEDLSNIFIIQDRHLKILSEYNYDKLHTSKGTMIVATNEFPTAKDKLTMKCTKLLEQLKIKELKCSHEDLLNEENAKKIGDIIEGELDDK